VHDAAGDGRIYAGCGEPISRSGVKGRYFSTGRTCAAKILQSGPRRHLGTAKADRDAAVRRHGHAPAITFDAPDQYGGTYCLDVGDVRGARSRLNGKELGTLLLAPWQIAVDSLRSQGKYLSR